MALSSQQIQQLLSFARANGLSGGELSGIEEFLLYSSLNLDTVQRTDLYLDEIEGSREHMDGFVETSTTLGRGILKRGAAELRAMSADEWDRLVEEEAPDAS